jgi:hypothetical protein
MAQDGVFFKKAAELNKFSVPEWSSTVFLGFGFMSYGEIW